MTSFLDWFYLAIQVAGIICGIIGGVSGTVIWALKSNFVTHAQLTKRFETHDEVHRSIDDQLGDGKVHFARVDGDAKHALTHADLDEIKNQLATLKVSMSAVAASNNERAGRMLHIESMLDRVLQFHIAGGAK